MKNKDEKRNNKNKLKHGSVDITIKNINNNDDGFLAICETYKNTLPQHYVNY